MTNGLQVSTSGGSATSLSYDLNGNLLSDGTNSYAWDAENRMIKITYPGTGNYSTFSYDGGGRNVDIVETVAGSVTSTKQFVWAGLTRCESRDASSLIISAYYLRGFMTSGAKYFYGIDSDQSIKQITNASGSLQSQYSYDPYGRLVKLAEAIPSDFGFTGSYYHPRSQLNLMVFRNYSSTLGKWLSRDPIGEMGGTNLSSYVMNAPASFIDPLGLAKNPRDMTCQELADEIGRLNDELINRNNAMGKNKNNLPVDDTHGVVFGNVQSRIRDLLGEFASRPCNQDLPADVWKWRRALNRSQTNILSGTKTFQTGLSLWFYPTVAGIGAAAAAGWAAAQAAAGQAAGWAPALGL